MRLILQSTQEQPKTETNLFLYYKANIKYHKIFSVLCFLPHFTKPHFTKIPPNHFVEMFYLSTKAQTVTRVDKEKFSSDLQVYIQSGQTFFSLFCPLHLHSLDRVSNCHAVCSSASEYNILPSVETHIVLPWFFGTLPTLYYQHSGGFCFHSSVTYTKFHPEHLLAWLCWPLSKCVYITIRVTSSSLSISPFPFPMVFSVSVLWPTLPEATCVFKSFLYF